MSLASMPCGQPTHQVTFAGPSAVSLSARMTQMCSTFRFHDIRYSLVAALVIAGTAPPAPAMAQAVPVFVDGQAQVVPAFSEPSQWIRHDLWVETSFDSDGDGQLDRVHVDVTRPMQTDREGPVSSGAYPARRRRSRPSTWSVNRGTCR